MQPLQLAVATANFGQPLRDSLRTALSTGARGVQMQVYGELRPDDMTESARRQFLHHMKELSLDLASLHLPTRRELTEPEGLDERLSLIRKAMDFAWSMKSPILTMRIGRLPEDPSSKAYTLLQEIMNDLARHGNHVGCTLCLIPTNDSSAALAAFVQSITAGLVGIDFDPAAFVLAGETSTKALRNVYAHVLHVQARDAMRDIDGTGLETAIGRGQVDWEEFLALLAEIPYGGWVTVNRTQGQHRIMESAAAIEFLTELGFH